MPLAKQAGPVEWVTIVTVIKDAGIIAGAAAAISRLVREIMEWRKKTTEDGKKPHLIFRKRDGRDIDVTTVSQDRLERFFKDL